MSKRVLRAVLLVLTLALGSNASARCRQDDLPPDEKVSVEEEREALEIAGQFVKSFEEKNDLLSLMDSLYVRDFDARLRDDLDRYIYLASVEPELAARATDEDLRRLYAASLNFSYAGGLLYGMREYKKKLSADESSDSEGTLNELLPPNVIAILKTDPILAEMIAEAEKEEEGKSSGQLSGPEERADKDSKKEERTAGNEIRSLEELRGYVSTLEKAGALIREHLKTLPAPRTWDELASALSALEKKDGKSDDNGCDRMCPRITVLSNDFFGCPKGTRLVRLNVMAFHMDLVRVDGRLRILNVYVADD